MSAVQLQVRDSKSISSVSTFDLSQYIINPYFQFGDQPPQTRNAWVELARSSVVVGGEYFEVAVPPKRFLMVLCHWKANGNNQINIRVGKTTIDTGANYTYRNSLNGAIDATAITESRIYVGTNIIINQDMFTVFFIDNNPSGEKFVQGHFIGNQGAGAGNVPQRTEYVGKWTNRFDQIDIIRVGDQFETGTINSGELIVLGFDPTDGLEATADFWELLHETVLTANADLIDTGVFATKDYLWVEIFLDDTFTGPGTLGSSMIFNNDSGVKYARRGSQNGSADFAFPSLTTITNSNTITGNQRVDMFILNKATIEKMLIEELLENVVLGSATIGTRGEQVAKFTEVVSQITRIKSTNVGTADYGIGSRIRVWGHN